MHRKILPSSSAWILPAGVNSPPHFKIKTNDGSAGLSTDNTITRYFIRLKIDFSTIVGTGPSGTPLGLVLHLHLAVNPGEVTIHLEHTLQLLQLPLFLFDLRVGFVLLDLGQERPRRV